MLQVVFHARMAEEAGLFDFGGVVEAITAKLVRRHPHVFGDAGALSSDEVKALWGRIKADEKRAKLASEAKDGRPAEAKSGALDGVPLALPALSRAMKLQEKAGKVGFDWNDVRAVLEKIREEIVEVEAEIADGSAQALSGEVGDLLFAAVNLARHLKVDPEAALRSANAKFERRFAHIENRLAEDGQTPEGASLDEMERLWVEAKAEERRRGEGLQMKRRSKSSPETLCPDARSRGRPQHPRDSVPRTNACVRGGGQREEAAAPRASCFWMEATKRGMAWTTIDETRIFGLQFVAYDQKIT